MLVTDYIRLRVDSLITLPDEFVYARHALRSVAFKLNCANCSSEYIQVRTVTQRPLSVDIVDLAQVEP